MQISKEKGIAMTSYSERLKMESRARATAGRTDLSEPTRAKFKSAAGKLEVANGLEAAHERRRARVAREILQPESKV